MYIIIFYFENGSNDFDDKLTSIELSEHFEWKINYICHPSNGYKGIFSMIWYKVKEKRQVGKCALVHLSIYTFVLFSLENWKNLLWGGVESPYQPPLLLSPISMRVQTKTHTFTSKYEVSPHWKQKK